MGSDGNAFRAIPRWIRLVMGFPKMPKLRMSIHFSVTKSTLKLCVELISLQMLIIFMVLQACYFCI